MHTTVLLSALIAVAGFAIAQKTPTSPANESRTPAAVRSPYSTGADLTVPLCPAQFHDSLAQSGVAGRKDQGVTPAKIKTTVPALITQQAIDAAGKTHIGNFTVVVNALVDSRGNPQKLCLQKSSGYGLDASAAKALQQYHFDPAEKRGKAVPMRLPVAVRFVNPSGAFLWLKGLERDTPLA